MGKYFIYIFTVLVLADLSALAFSPALRWATKPLIVLSLISYVGSTMGGRKEISLLLTALVFALLGDILLLINLPTFFYFGLGAFLIMQILYIVLFRQIGQTKRMLSKVLMILAYAGILLYILLPNLDLGLQIAVSIYALCLIVMFLVCWHIPRQIPGRHIIVYGAMLFLISDSLLAYNKFVETSSIYPYLVMLTYAAAQYLLVKGYLKRFISE